MSDLLPSPGAASPRAVDLLRRTRPWTMFLSIMGFVGAGIMVIATIAMVAVGLIGGASEFGGSEAGMLLGMGAMYAVLTALYLVISISLFGYARAIGALSRTGGGAELEDALDAQRRFWKLMGIVVIVTMSLMVLAFLIGIGVAVAVGASGGSF
jgi:hypothetical protein